MSDTAGLPELPDAIRELAERSAMNVAENEMPGEDATVAIHAALHTARVLLGTGDLVVLSDDQRLQPNQEPQLGLATREQLIDELVTTWEVHGPSGSAAKSVMTALTKVRDGFADADLLSQRTVDSQVESNG